eukprot:950467_1
MLKKLLTIIVSIFIFGNINPVEAGPFTCAAGMAFYATCQTACNAGWVTCMGASGLVAGTTGPVGWWAWATSAAGACSAVQGVCMGACAVTAASMCAAPVP